MTDKSTEVIPLSSKPRFEILDGLRGVAAMIVVAFHLFETYSAGPKYQIFNHGYLAVDFFFVLSAKALITNQLSRFFNVRFRADFNLKTLIVI